MQEEERVWVKGAEPRLLVLGTTIDTLGADALKLLLKLRLSHFDRPQFAVSPKAMAATRVFQDWSHQRYRMAREELLHEGYLKLAHKGGSRPGDPSLFAFLELPAVMGTTSVSNNFGPGQSRITVVFAERQPDIEQGLVVVAIGCMTQ
jgi:hypothetical protein